MSWTRPEFVEIKMDAEIGSYQEDSEGPYFARPKSVDASAEGATSSTAAE